MYGEARRINNGKGNNMVVNCYRDRQRIYFGCYDPKESVQRWTYLEDAAVNRLLAPNSMERGTANYCGELLWFTAYSMLTRCLLDAYSMLTHCLLTAYSLLTHCYSSLLITVTYTFTYTFTHTFTYTFTTPQPRPNHGRRTPSNCTNVWWGCCIWKGREGRSWNEKMGRRWI